VPIYSDLLLVKAILSSVQDLLRGILKVEPSYHMIWPFFFGIVDDGRLQ